MIEGNIAKKKRFLKALSILKPWLAARKLLWLYTIIKMKIKTAKHAQKPILIKRANDFFMIGKFAALCYVMSPGFCNMAGHF